MEAATPELQHSSSGTGEEQGRTDDEGVVDLLHAHDVVVRLDQAPLGGHLDRLLQQRLARDCSTHTAVSAQLPGQTSTAFMTMLI